MRGHMLRFQLKNGVLHVFDGFPAEAQHDLEQFAREHWGVPVEVTELAVKGHNWGRVALEDGRLQFLVGDKLAFDLGLKEATNVVQSAKDEVAIEFTPGEAERRLDGLAEIRFYIPSAPKKDVDDMEDIEEEVADVEGGDEEGEEGGAASTGASEDRAAALFADIKKVTDLDNVSGDMFVELPELPCIVPRGRYNLEMGATFLRLHGKSYDYKILYTQLVKLFMVPKADDTHIFFVLNVDPPIRQGQTRYPFLVFQFDRDELADVTLKNIDEETLQEQYGGRLAAKYEGTPTFEVVSTLFRVLAGQKLLVPGGSYRGPSGATSVRCALKATEGALYPLERNILFLPKPPTLLPHSDIANVEFSRVGSGMGNPRSFDVKISLRSGTSYAFSNAAKEDYQALEEYCRLKELPFTRQEEPGVPGRRRADEADDLGLARKRSALELAEDDSEDDEEYVESDEGSSVAEEYDEDASGSDSSEGDDDEDDEEEESDGDFDEDEDDDE